jgi:hypothetical protein
VIVSCKWETENPQFSVTLLIVQQAGHDLKGRTALLSSFLHESFGIRVPLMSLIDYMGYRVLVMLDAPIDHHLSRINCKQYLTTSLDKFNEKHKSAMEKLENDLKADEKNANLKDALTALRNEKGRREQMVQDVNRLSHLLADKLNLRTHKIKVPETGDVEEFELPFDLEIHEGSDGRIYALDLARLLPPETNVGRYGYLFRLFRSEFMKTYPKRLSSDAFNSNSVTDTEPYENITVFPDEVEATNWLRNDIIPTAAMKFTDENQKDAATLKSFMHEKGINLRYLALFLYHVRNRAPLLPSLPEIKGEVLQMEMVARAYTHMMNTAMRSRTLGDSARKKSCAHMLGDILNGHCHPELILQLKKMYCAHLEGHECVGHLNSLFDNKGYWSNIIKKNGIVSLLAILILISVFNSSFSTLSSFPLHL